MTNEERLNNFRAQVTKSLEATQMRAEESDKLEYIEDYRRRGVEEGFQPNWAKFIELWEKRKNSDDDMAELLAEVVGVAHDEALAWIEDY